MVNIIQVIEIIILIKEIIKIINNIEINLARKYRFDSSKLKRLSRDFS